MNYSLKIQVQTGPKRLHGQNHMTLYLSV